MQQHMGWQKVTCISIGTYTQPCQWSNSNHNPLSSLEGMFLHKKQLSRYSPSHWLQIDVPCPNFRKCNFTRDSRACDILPRNWRNISLKNRIDDQQKLLTDWISQPKASSDPKLAVEISEGWFFPELATELLIKFIGRSSRGSPLKINAFRWRWTMKT